MNNEKKIDYSSYYTIINNRFASISTTLIINGSTSGETNFETQDKLYLLSAQEVWNGNDHNTSKQLDYYKNQGVITSSYAGVIKNTMCWLRSVYSDYAIGFLYVIGSGRWGSNDANYFNGVFPSFRIA